MTVKLPLDLSVPQPGGWDEEMAQGLMHSLELLLLDQEASHIPISIPERKTDRQTDRQTGGETALLISFQHIT